MKKNKIIVFLDTSVLIAAIFSDSGGSREILKLSEMGLINIIVSINVINEIEQVLKIKAPNLIPKFVTLLKIAKIRKSVSANKELVLKMSKFIKYNPDAIIVADAIYANANWLVSLDKKHILSIKLPKSQKMKISTPAVFIKYIRSDLAKNTDY